MDTMKIKNLPGAPVDNPVEISLDNPFDGISLHDHICVSCGEQFFCTDSPWFCHKKCPDCEEPFEAT